MSVSVEAIIYYLVLLDAVIANIINLFAREWYNTRFKKLSKYLPVVTTWAVYYLILVLWIGWALTRLGVVKIIP